MELLQQGARRGLLRPVRALALAAARRWPWPVAARILTGRRMYVDLRSGIGRAILVKGEFDPAVAEPIEAALGEGGVFIDVGANVGYYSMLALDRVGPTGEVHAFEIDERPLRCLRRTIAHGRLDRLHLHEIAAGKSDGMGYLVEGEEIGHSSVETMGGGKPVRMTALDNWRERHGVRGVQVIKLDVEGGELWILQGAERLLREERPVVVCEIDDATAARAGYTRADLVGYLQRLEYRVEPLPRAWTATVVAYPA